jgi:four helix bundle protein
VSNIAEGQRRRTTTEFVRFLEIARGSQGELEAQIILSVDLGYVQKGRASSVLAGCEEVGRLLNGFIRSLQHNVSSKTRRLTR